MLRCIAFAVNLAVLGWLPATRAETPAEWAVKHVENLVELYRQFHQMPELSSQEEKTAARVAELWKDAGVEVHDGVGGHGVVGLVKNGSGPTLMLRTDLDALPVIENTGLVYASQVKVKNADGTTTGVMHACGHDIHITNLVGVAQFLASHKPDWSGTVMLIGQPAEERGEGAQRMIDDGLFTKFPKPDMALALHVDATLETGKIGYRSGYTLANVDSVDVTMHGRGGHGAAPHPTIDPIVQAAQLILSLQTLVSREMNPVEPAVVTVGSIHGGTKHNVIPDSCRLQLTVRSYSDEVRQKLLEGIRRKANAVADGAGAPKPTVEVLDEFTPALFNDAKLIERLLPTFRKALGESNVVPSEPSMGGEDFSRYGRAGVPIFMFRLGSVEPVRLAGLKRGGLEPPSLHSAIYYPDAEKTLVTGITAMSAAVLELLAPKK
ncbi:MAG TPA: amidohydrolase [Pirellulales bacterium]|nr:amidohydrolase [Pirellulales bacterium]